MMHELRDNFLSFGKTRMSNAVTSRITTSPNQPMHAINIISRLSEKAAAVEESQICSITRPSLSELLTMEVEEEKLSLTLPSSSTTLPEDSDDSESDDTVAYDSEDEEEDCRFDDTGHIGRIRRLPHPSVIQINKLHFHVRQPMSLEEIVACLHLAVLETANANELE